jgi:hypothetical protein
VCTVAPLTRLATLNRRGHSWNQDTVVFAVIEWDVCMSNLLETVGGELTKCNLHLLGAQEFIWIKGGVEPTRMCTLLYK